MASTPRFRRLYLHIGLDKTGTTTVQQALASNPEALEGRHDIHFPADFSRWPGFQGNHSDLLRPLFAREPRANRRLAARGLHSAADIRQFNRQNLAELEAGFDRSVAKDLLLSAEVISHFKPADLRDLATWCRELAAQVRVIACIRHPVHGLSSEIQQRLRIGARLENLYQNPPVYRLRELIENLEQAFGADTLRPYSFHRAVEHRDGLTAALLAQCDRQAAGGYKERGAANPSMSAEAAVMLSAYNRERPAFIMGQVNPARSQEAVQGLAAIPGDTYLAPAEVHALAETLVADDLTWLQGRYSIDLTHPPVAMGEWDRRIGDAQTGAIALARVAQQADHAL